MNDDIEKKGSYPDDEVTREFFLSSYINNNHKILLQPLSPFDDTDDDPTYTPKAEVSSICYK